MNQYLSVVPTGGAPLTAKEREELLGGLWILLGEQVRRYTMGDSSSVPVEIAQELYQSILFTIDAHRMRADSGATPLPRQSPAQLLEAGQQEIFRQVDRGKRLLWVVRATALPWENRSYQDTLAALPDFFRQYDVRFFAHEIPCDIDYQLCNPVPPETPGIAYMNAYLESLLIENRFCGAFESARVVALLRAYCPDWRELLINLFDALFTNAMGLMLLQKDVFALEIEEEDRRRLLGLLRGSALPRLRRELQGAADSLCQLLKLKDVLARQYLQRAAANLSDRVQAAVWQGGLERLFLSFAHETPKPQSVFLDGTPMEECALRDLIDQLQDCPDMPSKIVRIRQRVHSVRDLEDVLGTCFFGDEFEAVFQILGDVEIAVLLHRLKIDPPAWGQALREYAERLPLSRKEEIARCGENLPQ